MKSSFLNQFGGLAAQLERLGAIPVDIRDAADGSLASRTTLASLATGMPQAIDAGDYKAICRAGRVGITADVSVDEAGIVSAAHLDQLAERLRPLLALRQVAKRRRTGMRGQGRSSRQWARNRARAQRRLCRWS